MVFTTMATRKTQAQTAPEPTPEPKGRIAAARQALQEVGDAEREAGDRIRALADQLYETEQRLRAIKAEPVPTDWDAMQERQGTLETLERDRRGLVELFRSAERFGAVARERREEAKAALQALEGRARALHEHAIPSGERRLASHLEAIAEREAEIERIRFTQRETEQAIQRLRDELATLEGAV